MNRQMNTHINTDVLNTPNKSRSVFFTKEYKFTDAKHLYAKHLTTLHVL